MNRLLNNRPFELIQNNPCSFCGRILFRCRAPYHALNSCIGKKNRQVRRKLKQCFSSPSNSETAGQASVRMFRSLVFTYNLK